MAKNVLDVEVYRSRSKNPSERYRWRATAPNGRKVANGGEGYTEFAEALRMAEKVLGGHYKIRFVK